MYFLIIQIYSNLILNLKNKNKNYECQFIFRTQPPHRAQLGQQSEGPTSQVEGRQEKEISWRPWNSWNTQKSEQDFEFLR
jgi:hypothetical protein